MNYFYILFSLLKLKIEFLFQHFIFYFLGLLRPIPLEIIITLNTNCNMHCSYCFQNNKSTEIKQLNINKIKIIEKNISSNIFYKFFKPTIIIFGGEPTINPDFVEIINYLHQKNYNIKIITNGKIIEKYFQKIRPTHKKKIFICISLHDPDIEKIINKISIFNQYYKQKNYIIGLSCTFNYLIINKINIRKLLAALKPLSLHQIIFLHSILPISKEKLADIVSLKNQFLNLIKDSIFKKTTFVPIVKLSDLEAFYFDNNFPPLSRKCTSPWLRCNILSDGNLIICPVSNICGNILGGSLAAIWHSKESQKFRNLLRKKGAHFDSCKRCCGREFI